VWRPLHALIERFLERQRSVDRMESLHWCVCVCVCVCGQAPISACLSRGGGEGTGVAGSSVRHSCSEFRSASAHLPAEGVAAKVMPGNMASNMAAPNTTRSDTPRGDCSREQHWDDDNCTHAPR